MYAIVETGGKQYRVQPGDTIAVERLPGEPGEMLELDRVLLIGGDGERARVGSPEVAGAVVRAEVVEHARGEKVIVFRYKSKVRYRRKTGHRQALTRLRIQDILVDGNPLPLGEAVSRVRAAAEPETPPEPLDKIPLPEGEGSAPRRRRSAPAAAVEEATAASVTAEAEEATATKEAAVEEDMSAAVGGGRSTARETVAEEK
jgi:large subunit ribosomal protein L21